MDTIKEQIGEERYTRHRANALGATCFGLPVKDMDRDDLLVLFSMMGADSSRVRASTRPVESYSPRPILGKPVRYMVGHRDGSSPNSYAMEYGPCVTETECLEVIPHEVGARILCSDGGGTYEELWEWTGDNWGKLQPVANKG